MSAPDALIPNVPGLFWKQVGRSGWLYNGPVVFSAPDRYSRGELRQKVGCVIGCVPDNHSILWVLCWSDSFTEDEKVAVESPLLHLPLRFRGQVYEECVSRAKGYLVDRTFPDLLPDQKLNATWEKHRGLWTLRANDRSLSFPEIEGDDALVTLAEVIRVTDEARWK